LRLTFFVARDVLLMPRGEFGEFFPARHDGVSLEAPHDENWKGAESARPPMSRGCVGLLSSAADWYSQAFPPSGDGFDGAAQAAGESFVRHFPQQRIRFWSPVVAVGWHSKMKPSSSAHARGGPFQPLRHLRIRSRAQQCIFAGLPGPWAREFFPAGQKNAEPMAAMLHRQLADSQERRNLRIRALGQQFVVCRCPPVFLGIENGNAFGHPASGHTLDASLQPPRQPLIRHCAQPFFFKPAPNSPVRAKRGDATFASATGYRLP
jgi:hypothetical protein